MDYQPSDLLTVHARLDSSCASIELQRVELPEEIESGLPAADEYRIDFSLTARIPDARLSFQDHWPAHRFEQLGKIWLLPPGEAVRARGRAGSQEAVICLLKRSVIDNWLEGTIGYTDRDLEACLDIHSLTIGRLMVQLGEECRTPGFASVAMCEALSMQVAVELGRHRLEWDKAGSAPRLASWRLALIEDRLREVGAPPTLAELAALCCISARHLTRGFRASRGCSIGSFIRDRQVDAAKRQLATGESIKAIAYRLGFSSRSSFSHAFQKVTGMAPRQFREHSHAERHRRDN